MCVCVENAIAKYNERVHAASRTGHLSLALAALINPFAAGSELHNILWALVFLLADTVQPLEPIKTSLARHAQRDTHTHTFTHDYKVCTLIQSHCYCVSVHTLYSTGVSITPVLYTPT